MNFSNIWLTNPRRIIVIKTFWQTIPVCPLQCERVSSQMNLKVTPSRSSLLTLSWQCHSPELLSFPLHFDPKKYVQPWLLCGWHSTTATQGSNKVKTVKALKALCRFGMYLNLLRWVSIMSIISFAVHYQIICRPIF